MAWIAILLATSAGAQVDCSNPDNLCTGDPCVIPSLEVMSPCVADFGARALVVAGALKAPENGVLDLTAATIDVSGSISFRRQSGGPRASLTLTASGAITVNGPIASPGTLGGTVTLDGGSIEVRRPVRVSGRLGGGAILLSADGAILSAALMNASGFSGGIVMTAGTDITIERPIRSMDGGNFLNPGIVLDASGQLSVAARIRARETSVSLRGDAGVAISGTVSARRAPQGVDVSSAGGGIVVDGRVDVSGDTGADVTIDVAGAAVVNGSVHADGSNGIIRIDAASAQVGSTAIVSANGSFGEIRLRADTTDMTLAGRLTATGGNGVIECSAAGDLTAAARFTVAPSGCIALMAGGTLDTTGSTFDEPPSGDCPGSPSGAFLD